MNKSLKLRSGVTLAYVEQGDPTGVPVVMLHGYIDSWRSFELVLPHLPKSMRVFAISQRGHGDSDRPAGGYWPDDFASDVAQFMDSLQIPRAVIVGHSMGASVSQRVAIDYPARTLGLVLMGAFAPKPGNVAVREFWESAVSKLTDPTDPAFVRDFQKNTVAQPLPERLVDGAVRESLKLPAYVWKGALQPYLEFDFTSRPRADRRADADRVGGSGCFRVASRSGCPQDIYTALRAPDLRWRGPRVALGRAGALCAGPDEVRRLNRHREVMGRNPSTKLDLERYTPCSTRQWSMR